MAITWIDGFEEYSSGNALLAAAYVTTGSFTYGDAGRFSGDSLRLTTGRITKGIAPTSVLSLGYAFSTTSLSSSTAMIEFHDSAGSIICDLFTTPDGGLTFVRGSSVGSNILATAPSGTLTTSTWFYLEVELTRHASAGAIKIYINGALVASATGVNTGSADVAAIQLRAPNSSSMNVDDLYITDTATRIGEIKIDTVVPTADTAQKDFTASTGTDNYAMVDELPVDGDTSYVTADTSGNADLYTTAGLSGSPSDIFAVQVRVWAKKTDTGFRTLKPKLKSSTTEADGVAVALGTTYGVVTSLYETDPATDAAWDAAGVNAAQIGMELAA